MLKFHLDYATDFMNAYKHRGFFGFLFLNHYSHDTHENLEWCDEDLLNFLINFDQEKSISNNTILIFMADHGPRFSNFRKSLKGFLRERNPFFSIYIPSLFKERYGEEIYSKFLSNTNKLLTPFDIHRTFLDFISLEKARSLSNLNDSRSISLFDEIDPNRTCKQAGIDLIW